MSILPTRHQIQKAIHVYIETENHCGLGIVTYGIVDEILTSSESHPHGIKVRLQGGQVGRVKRIMISGMVRPQGDQIACVKRILPRGSTLSKPGEVTAQLQSGRVERVKRIQTPKNILSKPHGFENLEEKSIPNTEDENNEFKEFYQYDQKMNLMDKSKENKQAINGMKQSALESIGKAVCSFGNSYGGFLYIGIKSDGTISGLERDLNFGNFSDYSDFFANHIRCTLCELLGDKVFITRKLVIKFRQAQDKMICLIQVLPSKQPLYLHTSKGQMFFVRGPTPRAERLYGKDQFRYIKDRFPDYG